MKNELEMTLSSRRVLSASFARQQIIALSDFNDGLMRPDKCGDAEPIRTVFDRSNISEPVRWLSETQGNFFYRKGRPAHVAGEMWNRTLPPTSRFPSPIYSNYWTGRFDGKWAVRVGIEKIEDFVSEMFQVTDADFGLLTTEIDRKAKNKDATSYSYQGFDLQSGIPGLYWINFFSRSYAEWLGVLDFPRELADTKQVPGGGVLLRFCESPEQCRDLVVLQKQRAAIEWLGTDKFFDIRFPHRQLVTPDWNQIVF